MTTRPSVSLLGLMGVIAVLSAGFAALRIPDLPIRASAFFTFVIFLLLTAGLGAFLDRRPAWIGFAVFGWGWLAIAFGSLVIGNWNASSDRMPVPMPIASIWLVQLHSLVMQITPIRGEATAVIPYGQGRHALVFYSLVQICHLWFSLLSACLGALLAWRLDGRRHQPKP